METEEEKPPEGAGGKSSLRLEQGKEGSFVLGRFLPPIVVDTDNVPLQRDTFPYLPDLTGALLWGPRLLEFLLPCHLCP